MPCLDGSHAPGSERAHLLPPAGIKNTTGDIYRFHRVIPFYPPDPCIRPNEADLVCPPEPPKHYPDMPPAGVSVHLPSDRFAFYKAREGSSRQPCQPGGRQKTVQQPCPPINSYGNQFGIPQGYTGTQYQNFAPSSHYQGVISQAGYSGTNGDPIHWPQRNQGGSHVAHPPHQTSGRDAPTPATATFGHSGAGLPDPSYGNQQQQPQQQHHLSHQAHPPQSMNLIPNQFEVLGDKTFGADYVTTRNAPQRQKIYPHGEEPDPACANPYHPAPYICQPVYNRKYLDDCPEQDGPPADSYTFL